MVKSVACSCAWTLALMSAGCIESRERPPGDSPPPLLEVGIREVRSVDLLFVVDNSNSMAEEQEVLQRNASTMLRRLIGAEREPDGTTRPTVGDLHVGVVSTDMGTGGYTLQTCVNPSVGDDGVLQDVGQLQGCEDRYGAADCDGERCPWLSHSLEHPDDGSDPSNPPIWEDFGCIASLGTGGCGMEQHLEASVAALTYQSDPGGRNEGFLRQDSVLAVIYVSDEDDCSTHNADFFDPSRDDLGSLCARCILNDDELVPTELYADTFRALRPEGEDLVIVGAIAGVPDGEEDWTSADGLEALRDMRTVDPANPSSQLRSCSTDNGAAFPPLRLAELVSHFGENGVMGSICRLDWTDTFDLLTSMIRSRLSSRCLSAPLEVEAEDCRVIEVLADEGPCPTSREDLGLDDDGRRACALAPESGWAFEEPSSTSCLHGELRLEDPSVVFPTSSLRLECRLL